MIPTGAASSRRERRSRSYNRRRMDADRDNPWARRFPGRFATRSRDYEPVTARGVARHAALSGLALLERLAGRLDQALRSPRVQILLLHHLFEDEVPRFVSLVKALARHHAFANYDGATERIASGRIERPTVVFTFDDGRHSCLRAGRILAEHGAQACFFVCPSIVGERDEGRIRSFCLDRLHYPPVPFLDWPDLEELLRLGHSVGNHTVHHANLARLSPGQATDEIAGAKAELERRLGPVRHFAWPYGGFANMTPNAVRAVFDAGHATCASAVRGCHWAAAGTAAPSVAPPACLHRDNVVAAWPVDHTLHFLAASARRCERATGAWPPGWTSQWPAGNPIDNAKARA
jgi:peptidoglycan/xylan/chitin deacetylase (PgdA/CDA1 family)